MARNYYTSGLNAFMQGEIDLLDDTIMVQLIDLTEYTVNLTTHNALDDIPALARVGSPQALTGKTLTGSVFDAADVTFTALTGPEVGAFVIYRDSGSEATSTLILYEDDAANLPYTPSGVDCLLAWDSGAAKVMSL